MDSVSEDLPFEWGKKRGIGGANRDYQFYESFIYDGTKYSLFDSIYLFKSGEEEPYIGKILKIWQQPNSIKKIKVLWFFLPCEIQNHLGGYNPGKNEIFLASGEGVGLANINPLGAIAGKCNVVCTSKNPKNVLPSVEELSFADYVFSCTFDVGICKILDDLPDEIAGVDVKFLLNQKKEIEEQKLLLKFDANEKEEAGKSISSDNIKSKPYETVEIKDVTSGQETKLVSEEKLNAKQISGSKDMIRDENEAQKRSRDSADLSLSGERLPKKMKTSDGPSKPFTETALKKEPMGNPTHEKNLVPFPEDNPNTGTVEVTRRLDADRSKWFKGLPWEERLQKADQQNTLVLLDNLDPSYSSADVEDIIYHAFNQFCTAKVIVQTTFQDYNYSQAYVIFKTPEAADLAVRKISDGCLMLPNGRPLVGTRGMMKIPPKASVFTGHLMVDKLKLQMQREEWRKAIATSHCSQPNTIEYEMAMDWLLLQERSASAFRQLHKEHKDEIIQIKRSLKLK